MDRIILVEEGEGAGGETFPINFPPRPCVASLNADKNL